MLLSDESRSLLLSHISLSLFIMSAISCLTNRINDTMIIHLPMVSYHTIIASYLHHSHAIAHHYG